MHEVQIGMDDGALKTRERRVIYVMSILRFYGWKPCGLSWVESKRSGI